MGKRLICRLSLAVAGAAACAMGSTPVLGQQATGSAPALGQQVAGTGTGSGLSVTLGVQSRLRYDDNLALKTNSRGSTKRFDNNVTLGVHSVRQNERLDFNIDGVLRYSDTPIVGTEFGIKDPGTSLTYSRDSANSQFRAYAAYRKVDLNFFQPLTDTNLDGVIDQSDLIPAGGNRHDTRVNLSLRTGLNDPLGFLFEVRHRQRIFAGVAATNLFNTRSTSGTITSFLQITPSTQGRVRVNFTDYDAKDIPRTGRQTTDFTAGVTRQFSPLWTVDASLGFTHIDETLAAVPAQNNSDGGTGALIVTRTLTNGTLVASVDRVFGTNGERTRARITRNMALPSGTLAVTAGAVRGSTGRQTAWPPGLAGYR